MRAPVDFKLAGIQPVAPIAQRVRRQGQCSGIFAYTHSAPVHRVDMHCPERLQTAITHTRDDREALPQCHSRFCSLSFAAQFRLIFRELACSFLASKSLEPTHERQYAFCERPLRCQASMWIDHHSRLALFWKCFGPTGDSPMQQRTRNGTTTHSRKVVQDSDAYDTTAGRRDKRGSPGGPQAIDMAWVLACRSVGARAAPCVFTNAINDVFGTVAAVERPEAWQ